MAKYVISDIHGQYDMFLELLEKLHLKDSDTLYILGDVLDRGPQPVKVMTKLMEMPNVICIVGNHEVMALECLGVLTKEITRESIAGLDEETVENLLTWRMNGGDTTIREFRALDDEARAAVIGFMREFSVYEEVSAGGFGYLLVHAGLGGFSPEKDIRDYSLHELIWERADYSLQYYRDKFVVTGHTPTQTIEANPNPGYIFRQNNHIAIDCGAHYPGGRLASFCLDTQEEFYSSANEAEPLLHR